MLATVPANTISKVIDQSKALEDIIYVRVGPNRHKTERTLISIRYNIHPHSHFGVRGRATFFLTKIC